MSIQDNLTEILKEHSGSPFLFIGSGFSRRYLGLEDWVGLLSKFLIPNGKPWDYYKSSANSDLPTIAASLAKDFHEHWWDSDIYAQHREEYKGQLKDNTSPLRFEISHYLKNKNLDEINMAEEIEILRKVNIGGIITTNWDCFLEHLFPDYTTYIGQQQLLFAHTHDIAEIYKIHGCCTKPESLVLTDLDYQDFESRNTYLAAKLITIFMEHPIIFIGYSLSDKNIRNILDSIVQCVGQDNLEKLRRNLIFVERLKDGYQEGIFENELVFDKVRLPIVSVRTDNFSNVYQSLANIEKKIPARIMRYFKEQFYEFAYSTNPTKQMYVMDLENVGDYKDIEFIVGIGVQKKFQEYSRQGYSRMKFIDVIKDILEIENKNLNSKEMLISFISELPGTYLPVYKYFNSLGIDSKQKYDEWKINNSLSQKNIKKLDSCISIHNFGLGQHKRNFQKNPANNLIDLINSRSNDDAIYHIPFLQLSKSDCDELKNFLTKNLNYYLQCSKKKSSMQATVYRKLIALYDKLKWGW